MLMRTPAESGGPRKYISAHRLSYQIHSGAPIPEGRWVLHYCDNPGCVNPLHLHLGNHQDNARESAERGAILKSGGVPSMLSIMWPQVVAPLRFRKGKMKSVLLDIPKSTKKQADAIALAERLSQRTVLRLAVVEGIARQYALICTKAKP